MPGLSLADVTLRCTEFAFKKRVLTAGGGGLLLILSCEHRVLRGGRWSWSATSCLHLICHNLQSTMRLELPKLLAFLQP